MPVVSLKLPYSVSEDIEDNNVPKKFIALWNRFSTYTRFSDGTVKIACGSQSILELRAFHPMYWKHFPYFASAYLSGYKNIHVGGSSGSLLSLAISELKSIGIPVSLGYSQRCNVDLTPSLCPNVFFTHKNVLFVTGFSGSGSMALEPWFTESVIKSLETSTLDINVRDFNLDRSLLNNLFPPSHKINGGISAI